MRFPRNAKIFRGQWDAAPFAGVLFLLMLLFLFTSRMAFTPGVDIELPKVGTDLPGASGAIAVVALNVKGQFTFENQTVSEEKLLIRLKDVLRQSNEPMSLIIHADGDVKYELVMRLGAAGWEMGFNSVRLAAQRGPPEGKRARVEK